jgi:hypothetical protein
MNLFAPIVPASRWHPIFKMLCHADNAPERDVLMAWARDFVDRDGKFVQEFQTTFESSFWELYVHAALRDFGMTIDLSYDAPDFMVTAPQPLAVEATIAAPAQGSAPAFGPGPPVLPEDLNVYNADALLRLCNSIDAKMRRYRERYAQLAHVRDKPFVIALAPFDRPLPQLAANRPIVAALYGLYFDEEASIAGGCERLVRYPIDSVAKPSGAPVAAGLFAKPEYADLSAVLFSPVATWGKLRALASAPEAPAIFTTLHPAPGRLMPEVRQALKCDYREHLLDGLYILHNPRATRPLDPRVFEHARVAQFVTDSSGGVYGTGPDDFLLMRSIIRLIPEEAASAMLSHPTKG